MTIETEDDAVTTAARAVERLRLAEARLARRRQSECGPSENARAAMRLVLERADAHSTVTPTEIAHYLGISAASVTGMLDRLHAGGLIDFVVNPADRRSKFVVPFDRATDPDAIDPVTARIRAFAAELPDGTAGHVAAFLDRVREVVDTECA
ncbi:MULTISPECIES: MarR family winged helix-turn-helix transcriptional regulator [Microbacterium]|uniref:MarR family winged helix-turn-helix transcriptional regulator n=1 Tax=Microbacterium TaxID=33882 RepID=UPI00278ADCA0|nr:MULTISPECIES: MarR family transcriptional regulator [Microbacterium]MDQ1082963.1 DNA-binding MarR family transcriptional regulator [Microbacterium sp. SORGH_AS_0344]MDQ1168268.1 DNA-binding MarR family transcriptional regulator [Microbacterium proteolyticum]